MRQPHCPAPPLFHFRSAAVAGSSVKVSVEIRLEPPQRKQAVIETSQALASGAPRLGFPEYCCDCKDLLLLDV